MSRKQFGANRRLHEMLYIKDIKPSLNTQADSIHANCLRDTFIHFYYYCYFCFCVSYTHRTRKHYMYFFKYYIFTSGADPGCWNGGVNFCNYVIEPKPGWGKYTNGTNRKSRVWPVYYIYIIAILFWQSPVLHRARHTWAPNQRQGA